MELNAFRLDKEKTSIEIPKNNIDISATIKRSITDVEVANRVSVRFLNFIRGFDTVRTNRLHVAIGGSLLGKKVGLYPNNYFKNFAIFEYSMKENFPNVIFEED